MHQKGFYWLPQYPGFSHTVPHWELPAYKSWALFFVYLTDNCGIACAQYQDSYFAWETPGIGSFLACMAFQGVAAFVLLFFIESEFAARLVQKFEQSCSASETEEADDNMALHSLEDIDEDVMKEHERIMNPPKDRPSMDTLVLKELKKVYNGGFYAVKGLSLGVQMGECFGLLGVNGAGKTSTFKMMTGDEPISSGEAYLNGCSVISNINQVRKIQV